MVSNSLHGNESITPELQSELWLICPICKKPNPAGTLHCPFCWGASLYSIKPVTSEEMAELNRKHENSRKRWRFIRTLLISVGAPLVLLGAALGVMYNFTDIIFSPPAEMNSNSSSGDWAMFRHDVSRSGSIDIGTAQPEGKLKWTFQAGAEIDSSPTVVNGTVYFGSRDYKLYAVDAVTGEERWVFQAESWVGSSPAVVDGVVYFGSNDGNLYAVDAVNGNKLWEFETRYTVMSSPAVADGMVFFGGDDYIVYALDAKTGEKIWQFKAGSLVSSSPVVANGILYVGSVDGFCYALNAENGRFRLRFKAGEILASPAVSDGIVYFTSRGSLYAIDGEARNWPGEQALRPYWLEFWIFRLAPSPPPISGGLWKLSLVIDPEATRKTYVTSSNTTPIVTGDDIYTTGDNLLYRINKITREFLWIFPAGGTISTSPALANNVIYFCSDDGRLYAIDAVEGAKLWDFATGAQIKSSPAFADGVIYFGASDGKLHAIE